MSIKRFGCVRFDLDDPNSGGWASVAGGRATRISNVGGLDNSTMWWSNLTFSAMLNSGLNKTPYIKRTTYLNSWARDGMLDICLGWGWLRRALPESDITQNLAGIFDRTMRFVEERYGLDLSRVPGHDNLADELRCLMLPERDPRLSREVDSAVSAAHQYFNHCVTPRFPSEGFSDVLFSVPPVRYAQEILGSIVPTDQFEFFPEDRLPPRPSRIEWATQEPRPVLCRVTVSNADPEVSAIIAYGNGAKEGSNRAWLSQPEVLLVSKFAELEIDSAFVFGGYEHLPDSCRLPEFTTMQAMTPTAEIVATNHWLGLCRNNPFRLEPSKERVISPRAAWLAAIDRFLMFTYARRLHARGIAVKRYGAGGVMVVVPDGNYRDAYEAACEMGLLAPTTLVNDIHIQEELGAE